MPLPGMPPVTAAILDKSPAHTTLHRSLGQNSWPKWRRSFHSSATNCGGDIWLIAFITDPACVRKILTHLGEPLEPPPFSPTRGPPTNWGDLVQVHDDIEIVQISPDELPAIDIHSL